MATPTETHAPAATPTASLRFAPGDLEGAVARRLDRWREERFAERLWQKDPTLWAEEPLPAELTDRLGWLDLPTSGEERLAGYEDLAEQARAAGYTQAVLLGMGGSSLAPEVFQTVFGNRDGYPRLTVLDSTHPATVRAVEREVSPATVLFLVASKSGTTVETLSLFRYFWHWLEDRGEAPGPHFVAVTDPGSPLAGLARERGFRAVFEAQPDLGGRYSALSDFGLVPATVIGVDTGTLLARARAAIGATSGQSGRPASAELDTPAGLAGSGGPAGLAGSGGPAGLAGSGGPAGPLGAPADENPALRLGALLGEAALAGRDKLTFFAAPRIAYFPVWLEQLVAESTGKDGTGILPVVDEPVLTAAGAGAGYGDDRVFVHLRLDRPDQIESAPVDDEVVRTLTALEEQGHPVVDVRLPDTLELGAQMLLWEVAVAAAGQVLGIHPFNQPDVELAKKRAKEALKDLQGGGGATAGSGGDGGGETPGVAVDSDHFAIALGEWLALAKPPRYAAIQAFLSQSVETDETLRALRRALVERTGVATTAGYGPRFLHSTGQLHKGGPDTGLYLQLVDTPADDLPVPETDTSFRSLIRAQAVGDDRALEERGRRVLRVELGADAAAGLSRVEEQLRGASREAE